MKKNCQCTSLVNNRSTQDLNITHRIPFKDKRLSRVLMSRLRRGPTIDSKMVLSTAASGRATIVTVTASRFGRMEQLTRVSGVRIKRMGKVDSSTRTAMFMMATGLTIKRKDLEFTRTPTGPATKASGLMIGRTDAVARLGPTVRTLKATTGTD